MARRRRRGRKIGIGKFLRSMPEGIIQLMLAGFVLGLLSAVGGAVTSYLSFNLTVGTTNITLDLGFIVNVIMAFAGIYLLLSGLYKLGKVRI